MLPPPARWPPEPDNKAARCTWSRDAGRAIRKPRRNSSCREGDISHAEGCRGDDTSRKATFPGDSDGEDGGEILAYQIVRWSLENSHLGKTTAPRPVSALQ